MKATSLSVLSEVSIIVEFQLQLGVDIQARFVVLCFTALCRYCVFTNWSFVATLRRASLLTPLSQQLCVILLCVYVTYW